VSSNN